MTRKRRLITAGQVRSGEAAVTYVELLFVIVMIALLAAIALPAFIKQEGRAEDSAAKQKLHIALRAAQASTDDYTNEFPPIEELAPRMEHAEPTLEMDSLPSLLAPARVGPVYLVKTGTSHDSVLLAAKSESGTLHTLFWQRGQMIQDELVQPTYEQAVLALKPSAYWPLSNDLLDRSGNGWTLTPQGQGAVASGSGAPLLAEDSTPSTLFDGGENSFLNSNYSTRRNLLIYPRITPGRPGWGPSHNPQIQQVSLDTEWTPFGGYSIKSKIGPGIGKFVGIGVGGIGKIPIEPGKAYSGALRVRVEGEWSHRMFFTFYDQNGSFLQDSVAPNANVTTQGDHWLFSENRVAPEGAAYASIRIGGGLPEGDNVTVWIAGGIIEQGTALRGPYFDGSGYVDEQGQWVDEAGKPEPDRRTGWAGQPFASESALGVFADGTQRTFIHWARAQDIENWRPMVGATYLYGLMDIRRTPGPNSSLEVRLGEQSFVYGNEWPGPNEPVMVALVVDEASNDVRAFVNGRELPEITKEWNWAKAHRESFRIGYSAGSGQRWYGDLGHVAVFERALDASQICALWQVGSGQEC